MGRPSDASARADWIRAAICVALLAWSLAPDALAAADGGGRAERPVELRAETIEYDRSRDLYVARGDVRIVQEDRSLDADWVVFSNRTRRGIASGNVIFVDEGDVLHADFVEFDVDDMTGVVFHGRAQLEDSGFRMKGDEIVKYGDRTYRFEKGEFTTCRCPEGEEARDPWRIRAGTSDLAVGGYGTARNTTFEVLGIPILWLPWMLYPIRTERTTGLLFPELKFGSRNGVEVGVPIFWAARHNVNVTLTPNYLSKRGFKPDLKVEYLLGEESKGELDGSFIHDTHIDANSSRQPYDKDRWSAEWRHDQFLPADGRLKVDLNLVSDNEFTFDFDELSQFRTFRFLPSNAFAAQHLGSTGRFGVVGGVAYADDLQSPDDKDRDDFMLQRFADVDAYALPATNTWLGRLVPSFDIDYTYFRPRENPDGELTGAVTVGDDLFLDTGIDALPDADELPGVKNGTPLDPNLDNFNALTAPGRSEGNGVFDEGEPLADRGHRLVLNPRLALPLRVADTVELYPEVGWYQTFYQTDAQNFESRGLVTGRLDLITRLQRDYTLSDGERQLTHSLVPKLSYAVVSKASQSGNPLFVPGTAVPQQRLRQLDLENVVRDPSDRIERFNGLTFGLENRLWSRKADGSQSRLLADFVLSTGYNFVDSEFGNIYLDGESFRSKGFVSEFSVGYDPSENRLDEVIVGMQFRHRRWLSSMVRYRYLRDVPEFFEDFPDGPRRFRKFQGEFDHISQIDVLARLNLTDRWAATLASTYSFEQSELLRNRGGVEYTSACRCWAARLEVGTNRTRGVQFGFSVRLTGLGDDRKGFSGSFLDGLGGV